MINRIAKLLDVDGVTLVVANGDDVRSYRERGVRDLYNLYINEADFLRGSIVVDKIVGRGAAALMIAGGVSRVRVPVMSLGAKSLFDRAQSVVVECGDVVPYIENRDKSGWCPVETLCRTIDDVDEMVRGIGKFLESV